MNNFGLPFQSFGCLKTLILDNINEYKKPKKKKQLHVNLNPHTNHASRVIENFEIWVFCNQRVNLATISQKKSMEERKFLVGGHVCFRCGHCRSVVQSAKLSLSRVFVKYE